MVSLLGYKEPYWECFEGKYLLWIRGRDAARGSGWTVHVALPQRGQRFSKSLSVCKNLVGSDFLTSDKCDYPSEGNKYRAAPTGWTYMEP